MDDYSFSVFPNENFLDLRLFQFPCTPSGPLYATTICSTTSSQAGDTWTPTAQTA